MDSARVCLLRISQEETYCTTLRTLKTGKGLSKPNPLLSLCPFIDEDNLLRVGGRLKNSGLPYDTRHPVILRYSSPLTLLIIRQLHETSNHSGPSTMMTLLSEGYHVVGGKKVAKAVSRKCVTCQKAYAHTSNQLMGQLPRDRLQPSPPFMVVGIDFAGPFITRRGNPRKPTKIKSYACLYICFATRAIHIEICSDLSTPAFMASLLRFVARRGLPSDIHTDNGTNFVGAASELMGIQTLLNSNDTRRELSHFASRRQIRWHFNPARTPHFGGLWESSVCLMKTTLRKLLEPHLLTFEELATVFAEAEATLNSRPLLPIDSYSTDDFSAITAGHFLVGRPLQALPSLREDSPRPSLHKRWEMVRHLCNELWRRWHKKYIQTLQARHKWTKSTRNYQIGDIVLLKDETLYNRHWPMARVTRTFSGDDGITRIIELQCLGKTYKRAVNRLVLLVPEDTEDQPRPPEDVRIS